MAKRALIVWGGWEGHEPEPVAGLFREILHGEGFETVVSNDLDAFREAREFDLVVPVITMAKITPEQRDPVFRAVSEGGTGLAGCHGGMCDAFREDAEWQFMTGGQWVAHPGDNGVQYTIVFCQGVNHPITEGLASFQVESEQYYLHTDPGNTVLATTRFPHPDHPGPHSGNPCDMPQVWTRQFGKGRVFYNALGHNRAVLEAATPRELMRRGMLWATR